MILYCILPQIPNNNFSATFHTLYLDMEMILGQETDLRGPLNFPQIKLWFF